VTGLQKRNWAGSALAFALLGLVACLPARGQVLGVAFESGLYRREPLFSFTYAGKPSRELLAAWPRRDASRALDAQRTEHSVTWTDPATRLQVRWVCVEYADFQAIEWTVYVTNSGAVNSPLLEDFHGIDLTFHRESGGEFILHGNRGDWCSPESFQPFDLPLDANASMRFAPYGGRPTSAAFPYYNVQMPGGGVFLAVGWPGQWASSFVRDAGQGLHVVAGQQTTHFYLKPGEAVRSPLIALLSWKGSDLVASQNLWRHWMLAHNLPRTADGRLPLPQIVACSSHQFKEMTLATEENQEAFIDRYLGEGMRLDYWWMDAGWYACGGQWMNTGTWTSDPARFPRSLRPISDHAHARGVKTVLWFEPERVGDPKSWLAVNHPEWLLSQKAAAPPHPKGGAFGSAPGQLLNLGDPRAARWLTDYVARFLADEGIDFYRQDFNLDPLPFWKAADAADRQGITENLYVQGYLAYWDGLRSRLPNLRIDSCASGGRRNDLETLRRAVPLLRSDYLFEATSQQNHHFAYASWIPYDGGGYAVGHSAIGFHLGEGIDTYGYRSNMCPSLNLCFDMRSKDLDYALARTLFSQLRQVGPDYLGDFYPLTPYSLANDVWMAWQYDRHGGREGMVQAFRRPDAAGDTRRLRLRGLDPSALYEVADLDRPGETRRIPGSELMDLGLLVTLAQKPAAGILTYRHAP
jgi:alpha-galactosidase